MLKLARDKGVSVVHSITTAATPADIAKELTPAEGEPIVKAPADKFFKTDFGKDPKRQGHQDGRDRGNSGSGCRAQHCESGRVPGITSYYPGRRDVGGKHYFEQYTAYHLANAPGVGQQVTLTKMDMIK